MGDKGFWATPLDLERCVAASISEWVVDYRLKSPEDRGAVPVPIPVVQGFIPSYYAGPEPGYQDKAPCISVRATQGFYLRGSGKCEVNIMIMTWDDDPSRQGYMDVSNLMTRLCQRFLYFVKIGNFVMTDDPIHFMEVVDSFKDFFPYFVGGISLQFNLASSSPTPLMASLGVVVKQPQVGIEGGQEGWADIEVQPPRANLVPETPTSIAHAPMHPIVIPPDLPPPIGPPPTLTSVTPNTTYKNADDTSISIAGTDFVDPATVLANMIALATVFNADNNLEAVIPASLLTQAGAIMISVENPDQQVSGTSPFTVTPPPPVLIAIVPSQTRDNGNPLQITLEGTGFDSAALVFANTNELAVTAWQDSETMTATVPGTMLNQPGTITIQVQNPDGQASEKGLVVYHGKPPASDEAP